MLRSQPLRWLIVSALLVLAFAVSSALAANGNCPNGLPSCFTANTPAVAGDVNLNFAQLKEWVEAKIGPLSSPNVTAANVTVTNVNATNLTTTGQTTIGVALEYETSCVPGNLSSPTTYSSCCRIYRRTGAVDCKQATTPALAAWTLTTSPFTATTDGNYSLACFPGIAGLQFPGCCRTNKNTGTVDCKVSTNWQLTAWGSVSSVW